jgi:hypothetical protein
MHLIDLDESENERDPLRPWIDPGGTFSAKRSIFQCWKMGVIPGGGIEPPRLRFSVGSKRLIWLRCVTASENAAERPEGQVATQLGRCEC